MAIKAPPGFFHIVNYSRDPTKNYDKIYFLKNQYNNFNKPLKLKSDLLCFLF